MFKAHTYSKHTHIQSTHIFKAHLNHAHILISTHLNESALEDEYILNEGTPFVVDFTQSELIFIFSVFFETHW
jgi:hypothetical protein